MVFAGVIPVNRNQLSRGGNFGQEEILIQMEVKASCTVLKQYYQYITINSVPAGGCLPIVNKNDTNDLDAHVECVDVGHNRSIFTINDVFTSINGVNVDVSPFLVSFPGTFPFRLNSDFYTLNRRPNCTVKGDVCSNWCVVDQCRVRHVNIKLKCEKDGKHGHFEDYEFNYFKKFGKNIEKKTVAKRDLTEAEEWELEQSQGGEFEQERQGSFNGFNNDHHEGHHNNHHNDHQEHHGNNNNQYENHYDDHSDNRPGNSYGNQHEQHHNDHVEIFNDFDEEAKWRRHWRNCDFIGPYNENIYIGLPGTDINICTSSSACCPYVNNEFNGICSGCVGNPCAGMVCDDNSSCTTDSCNSITGECIFTPITCNDNSACSTDTCDNSTGCIFTPITCNDNSACSTDTCNNATGCVFTPLVCNDNSACSTDTCNNATGCVFTPITCNDNSVCSTDTCNNATGCVFTPVVCNDNSACSTDTCNNATGCVFTPINCDDNNACTTDSCSNSTGCVYNQIPCLGDACNPANTGVCNTTTGVCSYTRLTCSQQPGFDSCYFPLCSLAAGGCTMQLNSCPSDNNVCTIEYCLDGGCPNNQDICNTINPCITGTCNNPCPPTGSCALDPDSTGLVLNDIISQRRSTYCTFTLKSCPANTVCCRVASTVVGFVPGDCVSSNVCDSPVTSTRNVQEDFLFENIFKSTK